MTRGSWCPAEALGHRFSGTGQPEVHVLGAWDARAPQLLHPHLLPLVLQPVNITDLRKNSEQDKRFTFIRSDSGPTTSFESAACPGWFLCTALEADQPVGLTNTPKAAVKVTKFYFQQDQ